MAVARTLSGLICQVKKFGDNNDAELRTLATGAQERPPAWLSDGSRLFHVAGQSDFGYMVLE